MDNPMFARVVIGIGALLVLIALFADPLGLGVGLASGGSRGLGWSSVPWSFWRDSYLLRRGKAPM